MAPDENNARSRRDFAWPDQRLVVETDGYRYHSSRSAKRRDNRRDRELTALGWRPVSFRWRPVSFSYEEVAFEPCVVGEELARLLRNARTAAR
jgi:very-short-patch-repair endonuclease